MAQRTGTMSTRPSPLDALLSTVRETCEAAAIAGFQAGAKALRKRLKRVDDELASAEADDRGAKLTAAIKPAVRKVRGALKARPPASPR